MVAPSFAVSLIVCPILPSAVHDEWLEALIRPFLDALARELRRRFGHRSAAELQARRYLCQWNENEGAVEEFLVRQHELRSRERRIAIKKYINIDQSRSPAHRLLAPHIGFDFFDGGEQRDRIEFCSCQSAGIRESRLFEIAPGCRPINRGDRGNFNGAPLFEQSQRIGDIGWPVAYVAAETQADLDQSMPASGAGIRLVRWHHRP